MKPKHLIIWVFLGLSFMAKAQNEIVDSDQLDDDKLNQLLLDYTNRERRKKRKDSLALYPMLDLPAKDHSDYMAKHDYVGHFQKIKQKKTVELRVNYFGGNSQYVGENVQMIPIDYEIKKSKNRLTYPQLARMLGENWRKSKGHYANMIDKNYTGISHQFTINNGYLYVCQVFSSKPFNDNYHYIRGDRINIKNKKPCADCTRTRVKLANNEGYIGWYTISNDSLYYWNVKHYTKSLYFSLGKKTVNLNHRKNNLNLIFDSRGEIAVDIIHYEQFDCKGNGAFHNALYYDGYYLGFLNKKKVKSEDIHPSKGLVQVYIAQIPEFNDEYFQVDYNYNKRKKPCVNNSIIFLRPDFFKPEEYFRIPKPKISSDNRLEIIDSIEIKIPFARNKTDEDSSIFSELLEVLSHLSKTDKIVESISYTGVASIEGSHEINRRLISKRGKLIETKLLAYYPNIVLENVFYENFIDFKEGLELFGITAYHEADNATLRKYANENREKADIKSLLNTTRQSTVKIKFKNVIQLADQEMVLSVENLENLIELGKHNEAQLLFQLLANQAIQGNEVIKDSLINLSIPIEKEWKGINWDYFVFELFADNVEVDYERLNELYDIGAIPTSEQYMEYRLLFNLFNDNEQINVRDFPRLIKNVNSKRDYAWLQTLEMISGVQNYRYDLSDKGPIVVRNVIQNKFDLFQTYFICQYLIQWGYYVESLVLLSKYARQKNHFPKLYKQYIKIAYYLDHFTDNTKYNKVLAAMKNLREISPDDFCDLFVWQQMGVRALNYSEIAELFCANCRSLEYE